MRGRWGEGGTQLACCGQLLKVLQGEMFMSHEEQGALKTCFLAKGGLNDYLYNLLLELDLELSSSETSSKLVPVGSLNRENHYNVCKSFYMSKFKSIFCRRPWLLTVIYI